MLLSLLTHKSLIFIITTSLTRPIYDSYTNVLDSLSPSLPLSPPLSPLPLLSSLLSSPFFSVHHNRARQIAACHWFPPVNKILFLSIVTKVLAHYGNSLWVSLKMLRSWSYYVKLKCLDIIYWPYKHLNCNKLNLNRIIETDSKNQHIWGIKKINVWLMKDTWVLSAL